MLHRHHPNRHMSVGGARNTVETVGELDGHYDEVFGAARAETSPNITVRGTSTSNGYRLDSTRIGSSTRVGTRDSTIVLEVVLVVLDYYR